MVDAKSGTSCISLFKKFGILSVPCQYIFTLMNSTVHNQVNFHKILLYTVLTQGISTVFTPHLQTFHVSRNVHSILAPKFSMVYHYVALILGIKRYSLK